MSFCVFRPRLRILLDKLSWIPELLQYLKVFNSSSESIFNLGKVCIIADQPSASLMTMNLLDNADDFEIINGCTYFEIVSTRKCWNGQWLCLFLRLCRTIKCSDDPSYPSPANPPAGVGKGSHGPHHRHPHDHLHMPPHHLKHGHRRHHHHHGKHDHHLPFLMVITTTVNLATIFLPLIVNSKVQELCKDFCNRYITCLKVKISILSLYIHLCRGKSK